MITAQLGDLAWALGRDGSQQPPRDENASTAPARSGVLSTARSSPNRSGRHWLPAGSPACRFLNGINHYEEAIFVVQAARGRMFGTLGALDPMRTFASIKCPTILVHSELDPVPVEWAHALVDTIPGADYLLLDGASHFPPHRRCRTTGRHSPSMAHEAYPVNRS